MRRLGRATIALPLAVIVAGILIPMLLDHRESAESPAAVKPPAMIRGKTAEQWSQAAAEAAARGEFNRALQFIKTAERADAGTQYASALESIRRAKWIRQEVLSLGERLRSAPTEDLSFEDDGSLKAGHRAVVALPGESLWSLARFCVATERGVLPRDIPDKDTALYQQWDRLVALNGLRELEVGERVLIPLTDADTAAIESTNRADLERIAAAGEALDGGDTAAAEALLRGVKGRFALNSDTFREVSDAVERATEFGLVEGARGRIEAINALPRASKHAERLELLTEAARDLVTAEAMREGTQYADARELVERLYADERRYEVRDDGSIEAVKPAGTTYTSVAMDAVEWALQRELSSSGSSFPNSNLKTDDERAWARYLAMAQQKAKAEGLDFGQLLSADGEIVLRLPGPTSVFAD